MYHNLHAYFLTLDAFNVIQGPCLQFSLKAFLRTNRSYFELVVSKHHCEAL